MQSIKTHSEYKIILFLHEALLMIKNITVYKNDTNIEILLLHSDMSREQ